MDDEIADWSNFEYLHIYSDDDECPSFFVDQISVDDKCPAAVDGECQAALLSEYHISVNDYDDQISVAIGSESKTESKKRKLCRWKDDEHRRFLEGVTKCGWSRWTRISKEYVTTKTPSQICSHAQKYLKRHENSERKRRSIHDPPVSNSNVLMMMPEPIQSGSVVGQTSGSVISANDSTCNLDPPCEEEDMDTEVVIDSADDEYYIESLFSNFLNS